VSLYGQFLGFKSMMKSMMKLANKHLPAPLPMSTVIFDIKGARQWTTETAMVGTTLIYRLSHAFKILWTTQENHRAPEKSPKFLA
jgi:hypothetical protein